MRLIDADELKKNIEYETAFAKGETWDWQDVLKAVDEQPTVVGIVSANEVMECLQNSVHKQAETNKEIRKWGKRRGSKW